MAAESSGYLLTPISGVALLHPTAAPQSGLDGELRSFLRHQKILARYGNITIVPDPLSQPGFHLLLLQNLVEVHAQSIRALAQGIRSLHKNPQKYLPYRFHRRALLIEEQLRVRKTKLNPWIAPSEKPTPQLFWTLIDNNRALCGESTAPSLTHVESSAAALAFAPNSLPPPPSDAWLKLMQAFWTMQKFPKENEVAMDLGSSPGSWSWLLASFGASVLSVDGAPLAASMSQLQQVQFKKTDAFRLEPADYSQPHWFVCDVIAQPERNLELIQKWWSVYPHMNGVVTLKFKGQCDFEIFRKYKLPPHAEVVHLPANKHELTVLIPRR